MAVRNRQIGWSGKANVLYDILRELDAIKGQFATTTTTTTALAPEGMVTVNTAGAFESYFDIYTYASVGWWMKMTNDTNFPRIFSFGQYPSAWQAVSIENNTLYFWYGGGIIFTHDMTPYIGQWTWVSIIGGNSGSVSLYINGSAVGGGNIPSPATPSTTMYIASENAPNTYYNGLLRDFVFNVINSLGLDNVPTSPIIPDGNTALLLFQGTTLIDQLTDQSPINLPVSNSGAIYNIDSPYTGIDGSTQFGAA